MARLTFRSPTFDCKLQCGRCTHIKGDGRRCKNRVCFGTPLCWIHTKIVYGVQVRCSTLPEAGKGLFATRPITRNQYIVPYVGELIDEGCLNLRYGDDTAAYAVERRSVGCRRFVDSACARGTASRANGLFNADGRTRRQSDHNAVIVDHPIDDNKPWLQATEAIAEGDEIFVWYGRQYILEDDHETKRTTAPESRPC